MRVSLLFITFAVAFCASPSIALPAGAHKLARSLLQAEKPSLGDAEKVSATAKVGRARRPFKTLSNADTATGEETQYIYEQLATASNIAYLLFAVAKPLAQATGSSNALLPYMTPTTLRLYASRLERCNSPLVERLYQLSQDIQESAPLEACFYPLYQGLQDVFAWVRDNTPLRVQEVPGQPLAPAALPDLEALPAEQLAAAVASALADSEALGVTSLLVESSCGLSGQQLAGLVPNITVVLAGLHADLPLLSQVASNMYESRWSAASSPSEGQVEGRVALQRGESLEAAAITAQQEADETAARRGLAGIPSNFFYGLPPGFTPADPTTQPSVLVPIVFHICLYRDSAGALAPANYGQAAGYAERAVRVANNWARPTGFQFFIREVRNDPTRYPYLVLKSAADWRNPDRTLNNRTFVTGAVSDFPRTVNVFIMNDPLQSGVGGVVGFAYAPGSDTRAEYGLVFVTWDSIATDADNSQLFYNDGAQTLLHELFHHLGLQHTFGNAQRPTCNDDDYVSDTPAVRDSVLGDDTFYSKAYSYCLDLFWGKYRGDWATIYQLTGSRLGIPEDDRNAWADTCPNAPGYDELGNHMTYTGDVCLAVLGHFTPGQSQRAHYISSAANPVLYAWGQYYAATLPPTPAPAPPLPEQPVDPCRVTAKRCACKASWTYGGRSNSYCDFVQGSGSTLYCEVEDPSSCSSCNSRNSRGACVTACHGTWSICNKTLPSGTRMPPPPLPGPPPSPPLPPPPPPPDTPAECRVAADGCACRPAWGTWLQTFKHYCAPVSSRSSRLWCQVTPDCPTFDPASPLHACAANLTDSYCGRTPPSPPPSPFPSPPLRPPPSEKPRNSPPPPPADANKPLPSPSPPPPPAPPPAPPSPAPPSPAPPPPPSPKPPPPSPSPPPSPPIVKPPPPPSPPPPQPAVTYWAVNATTPAGTAVPALLGAPSAAVLAVQACDPAPGLAWAPSLQAPRYVEVSFSQAPTVQGMRAGFVSVYLLSRGALSPAVISLDLLMRRAKVATSVPVRVYTAPTGGKNSVQQLACPGLTRFAVTPPGPNSQPMADRVFRSAIVTGVRVYFNNGAVNRTSDLPYVAAVGLVLK